MEQFKNEKSEEVIKHWGSIENFNQFIQKIKDDESNAAQLAIKQFGSIEKYTEAMKYNLEHFSEIMEQIDEVSQNADEILKKSDELFLQLTADISKDVTTEEIQNIVREIVEFTNKNNSIVDMGEGYWDFVIDSYSNEAAKGITEKKYGAGSADYIARALKVYFGK